MSGTYIYSHSSLFLSFAILTSVTVILFQFYRIFLIQTRSYIYGFFNQHARYASLDDENASKQGMLFRITETDLWCWSLSDCIYVIILWNDHSYNKLCFHEAGTGRTQKRTSLELVRLLNRSILELFNCKSDKIDDLYVYYWVIIVFFFCANESNNCYSLYFLY